MLSGGLRARGIVKQSQIDTPLITIITVVRNGEKTLEKTILSVINQTYKNIEYIIIDGASTDGTLDIIKKYEDTIDYWMSEPDRGIYDAMNKGINLATGYWVNFMNSEDRFYSENTIQEFINTKPYKENHYYGDNIYFCNNISYKFIASIKKRKDFLKHNTFSHQAVFYSLNHVKLSGGYNIELKVSADFDLTFRLFKCETFIKVNQLIAVCNAEGFSTTHAIQSYWDRIKSFKQCKSMFYMWVLILNFSMFFLKNSIVIKLKNTNIYNIYRTLKYKQICIKD